MLTFPDLKLTQTLCLWDFAKSGSVRHLPADKFLSMEDVDQAYGYIDYRHRLTAAETTGPGVFKIDGLHSYAKVYLDGQLAGTIDRRLRQSQLSLSAHAGQTLDVLVENTGRINFSIELRGERAGILGDVTLDGHSLAVGETLPLPLDQPPAQGFREGHCAGPCFYRGSFQVQNVGDTYLNTERLGKGVVWVNGHLLGRYWKIGPMGSLFLPGAWLRTGSNDIVVMDLDGGDSATVRGDDHPSYIVPAAAAHAN